MGQQEGQTVFLIQIITKGWIDGISSLFMATVKMADIELKAHIRKIKH